VARRSVTDGMALFLFGQLRAARSPVAPLMEELSAMPRQTRSFQRTLELFL
jgi:hypothetical protein